MMANKKYTVKVIACNDSGVSLPVYTKLHHKIESAAIDYAMQEHATSRVFSGKFLNIKDEDYLDWDLHFRVYLDAPKDGEG
jgi:hypothetical protein